MHPLPEGFSNLDRFPEGWEQPSAAVRQSLILAKGRCQGLASHSLLKGWSYVRQVKLLPLENLQSASTITREPALETAGLRNARRPAHIEPGRKESGYHL